MINFTPTGGDDTTAFQAALDAAGYGGGAVTFKGLLKYTALIVPDGVQIEGEGSYASILQCTALTGDCLAMGADTRLSGIKLVATGARTAGATVKINGNGALIDDCEFGNYFIGVAVGQGGVVIDPTFRGVTFRDPSLTAGGAAIVGYNYGNLVIDDVVASGPVTGPQPSAGIRLINGDTCFIDKANATLHGAGLLVNPDVGQNVFATTILGSFFDRSVGHSSGEITPAGNVYSTKISQTWFGLSDQCGLLVNPSGAGVVDGLDLDGCEFPGNMDSGLRAHGPGIKNMDVRGGWACANQYGYNLSGGLSNFTLLSVRARDVAGRGPNTVRSIILQGGASDHYRITRCDTSGNPGLSDGGTGPNKEIACNF